MPDIVARRKLKTKSGAKKVVVSISKPRKVRKDTERAHKGEWLCHLKIDGLGEDQTREVSGVDSMQALLVAVHGAATILARSGETFRWIEQDADCIDGAGFPVSFWCANEEDRKKVRKLVLDHMKKENKKHHKEFKAWKKAQKARKAAPTHG